MICQKCWGNSSKQQQQQQLCGTETHLHNFFLHSVDELASVSHQISTLTHWLTGPGPGSDVLL